jgi:hypothetical protein
MPTDRTHHLPLSRAAPARRAGVFADPGATFGRGHNRRRRDQPMRQGVSNTNTGHRTAPAATITHCIQIETLPMVRGPCRTAWVILRPEQLINGCRRPGRAPMSCALAARLSPKSAASVWTGARSSEPRSWVRFRAATWGRIRAAGAPVELQAVPAAVCRSADK